MFKISDNLSKLISIVLISVTGGFIGGYIAFKNVGQIMNDSNQAIVNNENLISSIAEDAGKGVVSINVQTSQVSNTVFGPQDFITESAGTGFIISDDGYVVTNRHVIPDGDPKISITLSSGDTFEDVSIIGKTATNDSLDIAFLKINDTQGNDLYPLDLGDSDKVEVGDSVVAIGNALGQLQNTVTSGIISGYGRDLAAGFDSGEESLVNLFQTDAAINQGNSGGPLVNLKGEVIGVNTAIAGGDAQNIGFAIPINDIKGLIKSVLENGEFKRPYLGVRYISLNEEIAEENNLSVESGAYLIDTESGTAVISGSPADEAGLKEGDVITEVNNQPINERNGLVSLLGQYSAGDMVELQIQRGGEQLNLTTVLGEFGG
ncbi:MAG TPA: trypsin-like peptidase domain-containing protein [Candidatus Saccharimonadales bacterium]|nr:trypsin-like peptidase domain-containing protein [Candidatus Saccharimonadales bacterium]